MKLLNSLVVSALLIAPVTAAATTVFEAQGSIAIDDLSGFGGPILGNFTDTDGDDITIAVNGALTSGILTAAFSISDASGVLLSSNSVIDGVLDDNPPDLAGPVADSGTLVFDMLSGSATGLFGNTATIVFDLFSEDADSFGTIGAVSAHVISDIAPIPLPASLPLLGGALLGAVALRRKRK